MSGSRNFAMSTRNTQNGERDQFCNVPPAIRRYHQHREQQILSRQLNQLQIQQNQLQIEQNRYRNQYQNHQQEEKEVQRQVVVESAEFETLTTKRDDSAGAAVIQASHAVMTNIDRIAQSFTPIVSEKSLSEDSKSGSKARETDICPFFSLGALWDCYKEWSVYGVGVPLILSECQSVIQYYVPSLSGIQVYIDPKKLSTDFEGDISNSPGLLIFEHLERDPPHNRRPFYDQISILVAQFPYLMTFNSCDLLPASWIGVAWYPIYRIPMGSTLESLDASFLTFHSLSTNSTSNNGPNKVGSSSQTISLPAFGLASYKLRGSILKNGGDYEERQSNSFLKAADQWLKSLKVNLPDFRFFASHNSQRR